MPPPSQPHRNPVASAKSKPIAAPSRPPGPAAVPSQPHQCPAAGAPSHQTPTKKPPASHHNPIKFWQQRARPITTPSSSGSRGPAPSISGNNSKSRANLHQSGKTPPSHHNPTKTLQNPTKTGPVPSRLLEQRARHITTPSTFRSRGPVPSRPHQLFGAAGPSHHDPIKFPGPSHQ